ncbi:non-ribosomal peptide synthetase, partial [Candidatus Methylobacter oryzae]
QGRLDGLFPQTAMPVLDLDAECPPWAERPHGNPDRQGLTSSHLAYMIYTSGSTGQPKGTLVEHRGVCNLITDCRKRYKICAEDRILQFIAIGFDASVQEIFGALLTGAALVLRGDDWIADATKFWALCEENRVSLVTLPTLFWQQLVQDRQAVIPRSIRQIIFGGEAVSNNMLAAWFERTSYRPKLFNEYGPTETTVKATVHELSADSLSWQSIGRPIANTRTYILDANKQPVPIGLIGELYIGGADVARGYLNRPELTEERFMADPFTEDAKARMYKTGDLARWRADGTIEFLGRNDFQVKIRGFRIELGDIEAKLAEHPAVREAAVLAFDGGDGDKRLVAYLVLMPKGHKSSLNKEAAQLSFKDNVIPSLAELRDFLKKKLPDFMVPAAFMFIDALPVTPNGKLNRKALPEPLDEGLSLTHSGPRNDIERKLADIWKNLLGLKNIDIQDNFFDIGGYSLLAVKMSTEINKLFAIELAMGAIYQHPTVEALAEMISSKQQKPSCYSVVPIQTEGARPPLFAVHTLTLLDLPRHLGKDQPLYFLRYGMAAEIGDRPISLPLLEELAGHYIKEMQQIQPRGPYYLMGFSFGGVIAYEMARQLQADGFQVNLVGLLDTYLRMETRLLPLKRIIRNVFRQTPKQLFKSARNKMTDLATFYKYGTDFWPHIYTSAPDQACHGSYQPKTYSGRVVLFQGRTEEGRIFSYVPPEYAWRNLLGDRLEVKHLPAVHFDICREPHVKLLAAKLIACMDREINGK